MLKPAQSKPFLKWVDREVEDFRQRLIDASEDGCHCAVTAEVNFRDGVPELRRRIDNSTERVVL